MPNSSYIIGLAALHYI